MVYYIHWDGVTCVQVYTMWCMQMIEANPLPDPHQHANGNELIPVRIAPLNGGNKSWSEMVGATKKFCLSMMCILGNLQQSLDQNPSWPGGASKYDNSSGGNMNRLSDDASPWEGLPDYARNECFLNWEEVFLGLLSILHLHEQNKIKRHLHVTWNKPEKETIENMESGTREFSDV